MSYKENIQTKVKVIEALVISNYEKLYEQFYYLIQVLVILRYTALVKYFITFLRHVSNSSLYLFTLETLA